MATLSRSTLLATDDSCADIPVDKLAHALNGTCKTLRFTGHPTPVDLGKHPVSNPKTYRSINSATKRLLADHSCVVIATALPYDNNFFFDSNTNVIITSFADWIRLTNLPRINGFLGFVSGLLADDIQGSAPRHEENTGCVYDFLWDKRGVDMRLRSGAVCRDCAARIQRELTADGTRRLSKFDCSVAEGYADLVILLEECSLASKRELDVVAYLDAKGPVSDTFDVFLCHNSKDKASVRQLYKDLVDKGIRPWFDEEHLVPGSAWQDELQATIPQIRTVAVIVGPNGKGPWQDMELRAFLSEFANRGCRVIPVILADAPSVPELPLFLRQFTWVDFRRDEPSPLARLLWGITGKRPN